MKLTPSQFQSFITGLPFYKIPKVKTVKLLVKEINQKIKLNEANI